MIGAIVAALLAGLMLGVILHKWIVREDLLLAEKTKILLGAKLAALKAAPAKVEGEIKDEIKKVEGK